MSSFHHARQLHLCLSLFLFVCSTDETIPMRCFTQEKYTEYAIYSLTVQLCYFWSVYYWIYTKIGDKSHCVNKNVVWMNAQIELEYMWLIVTLKSQVNAHFCAPTNWFWCIHSRSSIRMTSLKIHWTSCFFRVQLETCWNCIDTNKSHTPSIMVEASATCTNYDGNAIMIYCVEH